MEELQALSEVELLQTHGAVIDELRRRGVVRTRNNPVGDYTEWLVCNRLGLEAQENSRAAFDAVDPEGIRYQIKGRRSTETSVQFSAIRNLEDGGFHFVVAVVFDDDYSVRLAVKIPHDVVPTFARFYAHTNAHNLVLTANVVEHPNVEDISHRLA